MPSYPPPQTFYSPTDTNGGQSKGTWLWPIWGTNNTADDVANHRLGDKHSSQSVRIHKVPKGRVGILLFSDGSAGWHSSIGAPQDPNTLTAYHHSDCNNQLLRYEKCLESHDGQIEPCLNVWAAFDACRDI